jgi:hypothetical protein
LTGYYAFFAVIEVATTSYIAWSAFKWSETDVRPGLRDRQSPAASLDSEPLRTPQQT